MSRNKENTKGKLIKPLAVVITPIQMEDGTAGMDIQTKMDSDSVVHMLGGAIQAIMEEKIRLSLEAEIEANKSKIIAPNGLDTAKIQGSRGKSVLEI